MASNTPEIRKLNSLLSDYLQPGTKILKHKTRPLTAPGENYGSVMVAVDVIIQEPEQPQRTLNLVAKCQPANELLCEIFNVQETFKKEIGMYLDVIPALSKFQEKYGNSKRKISDLFAKCFGARINLKPENNVVDEDGVILFENLKVIGYDVEDRLTGFDAEQAYRILEDLARFHAIPIAFKIKEPEKFEKIIKPVIRGVKIADGISEEMRKLGINEVINVLRKNKNCIPYIPNVLKTLEKGFDGTSRFYETTEPFATIIHTDYWVNNTMILKDKNGKPIGNKIVDFQLPAYNTGAMDLIFFMYSSIMPSVLYENIDNFIKYYYDCFIECLEEFDIDMTAFSWEKFNEEIERVAWVELGHLLIMYKPILTERGTIDDMSKVSMDEMLDSNTVSADYEKRVLMCVLSFIQRNWI